MGIRHWISNFEMKNSSFFVYTFLSKSSNKDCATPSRCKKKSATLCLYFCLVVVSEGSKHFCFASYVKWLQTGIGFYFYNVSPEYLFNLIMKSYKTLPLSMAKFLVHINILEHIMGAVIGWPSEGHYLVTSHCLKCILIKQCACSFDHSQGWQRSMRKRHRNNRFNHRRRNIPFLYCNAKVTAHWLISQKGLIFLSVCSQNWKFYWFYSFTNKADDLVKPSEHSFSYF